MEVSKGKFYINKTLILLFPLLRFYGDTYKVKMSSIFKLGVGIFDKFYIKKIEYNKNPIFILLDKSTYNYQINIEWFKNQPYFIDIYPFGDIKSNLEMLVLEIPKVFDMTYIDFLNGEYSQMFKSTESDINSIFNFYNNKDSEAFKFFYPNEIDKKDFENRIKKDYNIKNSVSLHLQEIDYPLFTNEEIFNEENIEIFNILKHMTW